MRVYPNLRVQLDIMKALKVTQGRPPPEMNWPYHLTELVTCPDKTYYRRAGVYEEVTEESILSQVRGRSHHGLLEVYSIKEVRLQRDNVRMTVDMIGERPVEIYTTLASSNKGPEYFEYKIRQLEGYLYALNRTEGDLVILHLLGTWRPPKPELKAYTLVFDQDELKLNWDLVLATRELIESGLRERKSPGAGPKKEEKWQCNYCGFAHTCPIGKKKVVTEINEL